MLQLGSILWNTYQENPMACIFCSELNISAIEKTISMAM